MAIKRPTKVKVRHHTNRSPLPRCATSMSGRRNRWCRARSTSGGCVRIDRAGRWIAIAATAPGGKALTEFDDQLTAIKCPHCQDENLYRWSARSEQN